MAAGAADLAVDLSVPARPDAFARVRAALSELTGLTTLRRVAVEDAQADEAFGRLTALASSLLGAPVALVSIVDGERLVFKGRRGLPEPWASLDEAPLSRSFCEHVVDGPAPFVAGDARLDPRLREYAATRVLGVVAYAGIPLIAPCGHVLGTLCVIDHAPRAWRRDQIEALARLGACVMTEIELRAAVLEVARLAAEAERQARAKVAALATAPDAFFAVDARGYCTYANAAAEALLAAAAGTTRIQLIGERLDRVLPLDGSRAVQEALAADRREAHPVAFRLTSEAPGGAWDGYAYPTADGASVWLRAPAWSETRSAPQVSVPAAQELGSGAGPARLLPAATEADSDDSLVADVARRGPAAERALEELYRRYSAAVYGLVLRVSRDRSTADELLHETFWRLWRSAGSYEPGRVRFATWLLRIATNLSISELRRLRSRPHETAGTLARSSGLSDPSETQPLEEADPEADVPALVWQSECRRLVAGALASLPAEQRQAVELAYFHGLTHMEIARVQCAPPSTVKTRLALGLRKLGTALSGHGLTPEAAGTAARQSRQPPARHS